MFDDGHYFSYLGADIGRIAGNELTAIEVVGITFDRFIETDCRRQMTRVIHQCHIETYNFANQLGKKY